jgi:hypothetical protein
LNAGLPFRDQLETLRTDLTHPPLMYLLERVWMRAFGPTDNAVKLLVVLVNTSAITLFAVFAAYVVRVWRLASALFCTAYLQIDGVPNLARGYSLGLLLTIVALLAWELWRRRPMAQYLVLWAASMVLLVHTHYVGFFARAFFDRERAIRHRPWRFAIVAGSSARPSFHGFAAVLPVVPCPRLGTTTAGREELVADSRQDAVSFPVLPARGRESVRGRRGPSPKAAATDRERGNPRASLPSRARRRRIRAGATRALRRRTLRLWSTFLLAASDRRPACFLLAVHPALDARFLAFVLLMYWLPWRCSRSRGTAGGRILYAVSSWLVTSIACR